MNRNKLNQLFDAARRDAPPTPAQGFDALVMRQIQCHPARAELSISDLLGQWFPRLAVAAAALIVVCIISDALYPGPSLTESAAQLSDQFFVEN